MDFETLLNTVRAFQESRAILTAVELDVFAAIREGATAEAVAERIQANPRSTAMLLNAMVACELLEKSGNVFRNTPLSSRHLTGEGRMATMHSANLWHTWSTLTEAVRAGTTVRRPGSEAREEDWTEAFIAAMHRNATERAPVVMGAIDAGRVRRMLDVGGGSGAYAIAFAKANPSLTVDILDLEPVTAIARRHIAAAGVEDRVRTRAGDLRSDPLGHDYDLVFVSAICHMLGEDENLDLLRRCRAACAPGGRVVVQDFILNDDKTQPKWAALFALNMLVGTRSGNSYSGAEYLAWFAGAGLREPRHIPLPGPTGLIVGTR